MIDWTEELLAQIEAFSRVALSYPGVDGYPVVLPFHLAFDRDKHRFTLLIPHQSPLPAPQERVSLTLLHYDEQMKFERYLLCYGHLTETGNEIHPLLWRPQTFEANTIVVRKQLG